jgi:hypothetical protein
LVFGWVESLLDHGWAALTLVMYQARSREQTGPDDKDIVHGFAP